MVAMRAAPEPHHEEEQGGEEQKRKRVIHGGTHFRMHSIAARALVVIELAARIPALQNSFRRVEAGSSCAHVKRAASQSPPSITVSHNANQRPIQPIAQP